MKQQREDFPVEYQQQVVGQVRKPEHPEQQYSVAEIFSIRKESSALANEQIYKRLTKSFHKIKKMRADPNSNGLLVKEYDYESNPIRLIFKRAHDLYNQSTKTNQIVKRKIDKMRGKVDRIKGEIQNSQLSLISQVDINKIFSKGGTSTVNAGNGQNQSQSVNGQQQQQQQLQQQQQQISSNNNQNNKQK